MIRTSFLLPLLATMTLALAACADTSTPKIEDARIRLAPPGMPMAAGYFQIENRGDQDLVLSGVSGAGFESVEMHETVQDQGVSRMRERAQISIPAGGQVSFEPGGLHLMLFGVNPEISASQNTQLQLQLTRTDGSTLELPVRFRFEAAGE